MDKADLETLLYTRAACAGAEVHAHNGRLYCATPDKVLQRLLNVYNRFFEGENRRFLARDIAQEKAAWRGIHTNYDYISSLLGPCGKPPVALVLIANITKQ